MQLEDCASNGLLLPIPGQSLRWKRMNGEGGVSNFRYSICFRVTIEINTVPSLRIAETFLNFSCWQQNESHPSGDRGKPCVSSPPFLLTSEDLSGLTSQEGNPAKVLQELVQLIQSRLQVDACSVDLIEADRPTLVLAATVGLDSSDIEQVRMNIREHAAFNHIFATFSPAGFQSRHVSV